MKAIKQLLWAAALCLIEILLGILLLLNPEDFIGTIMIAVGCVLIGLGIIRVITYFRTKAEIAKCGAGLFLGLCLITAGILTARRWQNATILLPRIPPACGLLILMNGFSKIQWTFDLLRIRKGIWQLTALSAACSILICSIILDAPFDTEPVLWKFTGGSLIFDTALNALTFLFCSHTPGKSEPTNK